MAEHSSSNAEFFIDAVHKIEYGRASDELKASDAKYAWTVPILPVRLPDSCVVNNTLLLPEMLANSQYVVESLLQTLLNTIVQLNSTQLDTLRVVVLQCNTQESLIVQHILELMVRVFAANRVQNIAFCNDAAGNHAIGELETSVASSSSTLVLSVYSDKVTKNIKVDAALQLHSSETNKKFSDDTWESVLYAMPNTTTVNIIPHRIPADVRSFLHSTSTKASIRYRETDISTYFSNK